ncbi:MAG: hypothetical protein ACLPWF_13820 [Bryobacteraceae bacterium]
MPIKSSILKVAIAVVLSGCFSAYGSTIINFSSLSQPGSTYFSEGSSYVQQGFTFASTALYTWEASSPNLPSLNAADTSLFEFYAYNTTTLTDTGDAPFTLNSIDLAPLIANGTGTFTVTFTGTLADSSTVSQTFTVSNTTLALQTFDFSGFTNVVSVSFEQGTNSGFFVTQETGYQFDNLVIASSASSVPEPGSLPFLAIAGIGLIGFSGYQKWNRQRTAHKSLAD